MLSNTDSESSIFLRYEEDGGISFGDRVFDDFGFELLIDFQLFEFAIFWTCSVRSGFERTSSRDELGSVFRDVHVSKSAGL